MAKVLNLMLWMTGLILLFYFMGLVEATPNSTLLNMLLTPEGFKDSPISLKVVLSLEAIAATGIIIGFAIAREASLGIGVAAGIPLLNYFWDFLSVTRVVMDANMVLGILVFAPLILSWVVTMVEWVRGVST